MTLNLNTDTEIWSTEQIQRETLCYTNRVLISVVSCVYLCPPSQAILVLISSATFFVFLLLSWRSWLFCLSDVTKRVFSCVWLRTVASFKALLTHIRIITYMFSGTRFTSLSHPFCLVSCSKAT